MRQVEQRVDSRLSHARLVLAQLEHEDGGGGLELLVYHVGGQLGRLELLARRVEQPESREEDLRVVGLEVTSVRHVG